MERLTSEGEGRPLCGVAVGLGMGGGRSWVMHRNWGRLMSRLQPMGLRRKTEGDDDRHEHQLLFRSVAHVSPLR